MAKSCLILVTPWTVACQAPMSMGFSRQEDWSGQPFPFPGYLPDSEIEHTCSALQADSLPLSQLRSPKTHNFEGYRAYTWASKKVWEAETPLLKGMDKISHALRPSAEAVI